MSENSLVPVVQVDSSKCINCQKCILACPIKVCNNASGTYMTVNSNLCIGCGSCISACDEAGHHARVRLDDFEDFSNALKSGEKIAVIVESSAFASYQKQVPKLITALKKFGVNAVFNDSLGADIASFECVDNYKNNHKNPIISQRCPAVVTFIENFFPDLIGYLSPTNSPALNTAIWIHSQPEFKNHKIAVLTSCLAKRREVHDKNTNGEISYSVTFDSLNNYFKTNNITIGTYENSTFDGMNTENITFCRPSALVETFKKYINDLYPQDMAVVQGVHEVYEEYFKEILADLKSGKSPALIDLLNCEGGCCKGPGSSCKLSKFEIDSALDAIQKENDKEHSSLFKSKNSGKTYKFYKNLNLNFSRKYENRRYFYTIKFPEENVIQDIFKSMCKFTKEDQTRNCHSCGYGECRKMAIVIHNGLNKRENCYHYLLAQVQQTKEEVLAQNEEIASTLDKLQTQHNRLLNIHNKNSDISETINQNMEDIKNANVNMTSELNNVVDGIKDIITGIGELDSFIARILEVSKGSEGIISQILQISNQTNLLSLNAAIEAARAGESGRGFMVVSDEIRKLSQQSNDGTSKIKDFLSEIFNEVSIIDEKASSLNSKASEISEKISKTITESREISNIISAKLSVLSKETKYLKESFNE